MVGGLATEDIIEGPLNLLTELDELLLADSCAGLLLPLGLPAGTMKAPADDAPQHKAPITATAEDFMLVRFVARPEGKEGKKKTGPLCVLWRAVASLDGAEEMGN